MPMVVAPNLPGHLVTHELAPRSLRKRSRSARTLLALALLANACAGDPVSTVDPASPDATVDADASVADGGVVHDDATTGGDASAGEDATAGEDAILGEDTSSVEDATTEDAGVDACPADRFVVPSADPANGDYPAPTLDARCEGDELVVTSNGIIGYRFVPLTPNDLAPQDWSWRIPLEPTWLEEPVAIPLLGVAGFSVTGLPFYGPNEGAFPDPFGDPVYNSIVDTCLGHTGPTGDYHLHAMIVECIVANADALGPSPVIGYALDGYPIYGPVGCVDPACTELVSFESGWVQIADPTTYAWDAHEYRERDEANVLDRCNGRVQPDGSYGYHTTATFPYILGCYHGVAEGAGEGGTPGGGTNNPVPTACETEADCVGECAGGTGCGCAPSPMGTICVPTCNATADCPEEMTCNGGYCRPAGGPP